MCFSKISNFLSAKLVIDAVASTHSDSRLAAFKPYTFASLWSSRRLRAAGVAQTGVTQRR